MIKTTFRSGGDIIEVIIKGNELLFYNTHSQMTTTIEGLKLSKAGVIKEFPDLENDEEWKKKGLERFKEHFKKIKGETKKMLYIKDELKKYGYVPLFYQRAGHRQQKFKNEK